MSWQSKKHTTVALSTVEAEYMAMSTAEQEMLHLRQLLVDLGFPQERATALYDDNQGTISLSTGHVGMTKRTKHIDIRHHFIRDKIADAQLEIKYAPSVVHLMTKGFVAAKFRSLRMLAMAAENETVGPPALQQRSSVSI